MRPPFEAVPRSPQAEVAEDRAYIMSASQDIPPPPSPLRNSRRRSPVLLSQALLALALLLPACTLAAAAEAAGSVGTLTAGQTIVRSRKVLEAQWDTRQGASKHGAMKHRTPDQEASNHLGAPRTRLHRPGRFEHARTARWLVASNTWGVVSTTSIHLRGAPFGNIASFSDLMGGAPTGTPYFYLTTLDPTAADAEGSPLASFTLSEAPLGTCGGVDPENPLCAKLTLTGRLERVTNSTEESLAQEGLFAKHAEMASWPSDHGFVVYALRVSDIFLIDFFGGPKPLTVEEYFSVPQPLEGSPKLVVEDE